jgi:AraC-like DNA-binding protein
MEPLAQTILLARPKGLLWKQLDASGDWAIRCPANDGVVFNYVVSGECVFAMDGRQEILRAGDFVMLVRPGVWLFGNDAATPAIDYVPGLHPPIAQLLNGEGPITTTFGGRFEFDELNGALITVLTPPLTLVRSGEGSAGRLRLLLDLLGDEAKTPRPAGSFVLERLLELLLVEVIRQPEACASHAEPSLLRGLADPRIAKALQAMHGEVSRRWTVVDLAKLVGMSRSSFAAHFAATVGTAPIDYLLNWRMALAKDGLKNKRLKLSEVAERTGYGSASAFSAAFKRLVGSPPSRFAMAGEG